jgi:serine/threonine protein kinase
MVRDIKPPNVFISEGDNNCVKIGDFGLAMSGTSVLKEADEIILKHQKSVSSLSFLNVSHGTLGAAAW